VSAVESDSKGFVDSSNGFDGDIGVIAGVTNTYQHRASHEQHHGQKYKPIQQKIKFNK